MEQKSLVPMEPSGKHDRVSYVRYTPAQSLALEGDEGPKERIIQIVEEQRDPMEPARFRLDLPLALQSASLHCEAHLRCHYFSGPIRSCRSRLPRRLPQCCTRRLEG